MSSTINRFRRALLPAIGLLAVALIGTAWLSPAARAHNGVGAAFKGKAGPYTVYAYDGYAVPPRAVEYRLVLLNTAQGEPANDVDVHITATKPGTPATTAESHAYANVVYYTLPNAYPVDWRIDVRLQGKAGRGHVSYLMHGIEQVDATPVAEAEDAGGGAPASC